MKTLCRLPILEANLDVEISFLIFHAYLPEILKSQNSKVF